MQHLFNDNIEALTQASLIFILGVAIILSNLLVIASFINFRGEFKKIFFFVSKIINNFFFLIEMSYLGPQEVINIYLLSLAFADLICGLVIVPLSIYPALQSGMIN
jgi:dopamine/ecdysteroid receptor